MKTRARKNPYRGAGRPALALLLAMTAMAAPGLAEAQEAAVDPADLKRLSIEELMEIDVTSVSRRTERLSRAAAAVTVITQEDIRRSGVTSLPDALRLADPLHVARTSQRTWAISARGFNLDTANKMLVLIDGRSVYTPLFSGVFWDVQDTLLADVERIEVIRGPGATLWGANAVNGVINVITRSARDTQGGVVSAAAGDEEEGFANLRWGGEIREGVWYRAYAKHNRRDALVLAGGGDAGDPYRKTQGGFRTDWGTPEEGAFTVQGDLYDGAVGETLRDDTDVDGGNLLGRWTRRLSERSEVSVLAYYDRTHRRIPGLFEEVRNTWDLELQHHYRLARQEIVWGGGYRVSGDSVGNSPALAFLPDHRTLELASAFVQDQLSLLGDRLRLTLGTKLETNEYTGLEVQPSVTLSWAPEERQTLWASVSRAVRTPTRIDTDFVVPGEGPPAIRGNEDFESEDLLAFEAGWRFRPLARLSVDLATFYNVYDDLRSQEPAPGTGVPVVLANNLEAETYGAELELRYQPASWWRWYFGYSFLEKELRLDPGSRDRSGGRPEGNDPRHQLSLRSSLDLPAGVELDGWLRYVDELPFPRVAGYTELDLRLGWRATPALDFALVGHNLLHDSHAEFGPATPQREEVERSLHGRVTWRF